MNSNRLEDIVTDADAADARALLIRALAILDDRGLALVAARVSHAIELMDASTGY